jgi:hypothetical protein
MPRAHRRVVLRGALAIASGALALLAFATPRRAEAVGDPDLEWWTLHTTNFRVHYPRQLEPIASRVASLSEKIHERLTGPLGYAPKSGTEIVITDNTDSANGSATALPYNTIRLFVTAPDDMSPLGDYDDWMLELITHEYTHILHIDNISGVPALVNAVLGKTLAPNQVQPRWIIEGFAVVEETEHTSAGRLRSSLFDMYLRADVLDDNIARLDQISSYPHRWPQGNLWYLYGSRFLGWISQVYGKDTMSAVSADYGASIIPWGINRAIRRVTGKTYPELYAGWKDHIKRGYADQMREVERRGVREGTRLTRHGRVVSYPRFVPAVARADKASGEEIIYFRADFNNRSGLYRFPLGELREAKRREELVARTNGTSIGTFTPSGDLIFNSGSVWKNVYERGDLFLVPRGATSPGGEETARKRLTTGVRASAPDVSPDGKSIAFVVNSMGTTHLEVADIRPDGTFGERRHLVPSARFEQAYTPRFSPDGKSLAYGVWTAGGYRDIRIVDVATGTFRAVTRDRAVDMQPVWSPDGKSLYFSSDRTGIPNIYAYDVAGRSLKQVTNVRTGATQPAVSADGSTLVYVGYTSEGFDLYGMKLDPGRFLDAPPPPTDRPDPPTQPAEIPLRKTRYSPSLTLAPRSYSVNVGPGNYSNLAVSVGASGSDVVGHHSVSGTVVIDPDAPAPNVYLDYVYRRLPIDLGTRFFYTVAPRTGYRRNDVDQVFNERATGITAGISYPINGDFSTNALGLSYSVAAFRGDLPVGRDLDPYATTTIDPRSGVLGVMHLGYYYSNAEGSYDGAGPSRGMSFQLGVDLAERGTGSDFTLRAFEASLTAYVPMPWPGHHSLALRTSGAISSGSYPSGTYFVGGYDLENISVLDTITTGVFNSNFVLRGYNPGAYAGSEYFLQTFEYRLPLLKPDLGYSTLPLYLQRIDGAVFLDYGGAFDHLRVHDIKLFNDGYLIDAPDLHTGVGAELWFGVSFGYVLYAQLRLGYAYGFSAKAIEGGQFYFVASSAF